MALKANGRKDFPDAKGIEAAPPAAERELEMLCWKEFPDTKGIEMNLLARLR